jgi:hypothetical protein
VITPLVQGTPFTTISDLPGFQNLAGLKANLTRVSPLFPSFYEEGVVEEGLTRSKRMRRPLARATSK